MNMSRYILCMLVACVCFSLPAQQKSKIKKKRYLIAIEIPDRLKNEFKTLATNRQNGMKRLINKVKPQQYAFIPQNEKPTPYHISLVQLDVDPYLRPDQEKQLKKFLRNVATNNISGVNLNYPSQLQLKGTMRFIGENGVVSADIQPSNRLTQIVNKIEGYLKQQNIDFVEYGGFVPHVTIGQIKKKSGKGMEIISDFRNDVDFSTLKTFYSTLKGFSNRMKPYTIPCNNITLYETVLFEKAKPPEKSKPVEVHSTRYTIKSQRAPNAKAKVLV